MARAFLFIVLVALGAGGMYAYQQYLAEGGAGGGVPETPSAGSTADADALADTALAPVASSDEGAPTPAVETGQEIADSPADAPPAPDVLVLGADELRPESPPAEENAPPNPLLGAAPEEFAESYRAATKAIASGDIEQGYRLYRVIWDAAKGRDDIDVTVVARKLAEATPDEDERIEYFRYVAEHDAVAAGQFQASLRAGTALAGERDAESVRSAWKMLTRAYNSARNADERARVLDVLDPFLKKHLFSRRPSPLLERYRVQEGDHLSRIASQYNTSADAIRQLNGIENDVIRVGQRLLILPGEVTIAIKKSDFRLALFVDGKLLMDRPIGIGADDSTPEGSYVIDVKQKDPIWYRPGKPPLLPSDPRNILGTRWLGFRDSDGIGIHGTPDQSSIGKAVSSGCIRLRNADIELIYDFVPRMTRVTVEP